MCVCVCVCVRFSVHLALSLVGYIFWLNVRTRAKLPEVTSHQYFTS